MSDLIEALQIFLKYGNPPNPTDCCHNQLTICGIEPSAVSKEDKGRLDELGFLIDQAVDEDGEKVSNFISFRFGSA
jgi:hypothetical protein